MSCSPQSRSGRIAKIVSAEMVFWPLFSVNSCALPPDWDTIQKECTNNLILTHIDPIKFMKMVAPCVNARGTSFSTGNESREPFNMIEWISFGR